jgi:glycine/D-amino acid oxidase-like deaminating enzyme
LSSSSSGVVAVVGAGLVGLCSAWELVLRGARVRIYEGQDARRSCSWAGAGMLAPEAENFPDEEWKTRARMAALGYGAWLQKLGGDIDFLPPRAVEGRILDGHVDPRDIVRELSARLHGNAEFVSRRVESLDDLREDCVVVTAGAWASSLGIGLPKVHPVKGYLLGWSNVAQGVLMEVRHEGATYVLQRRRGAVIAGSTEERIGFDDELDWDKLRDLRRRAGSILPELRGLEPDLRWWGFRPATLDGYPVVRPWNERVVLAYGHYRNGILLAPWTGQWVTERIIGPAS